MEEAQVSAGNIQKFALDEGKAILSTHCAAVFRWASQADTVLTEKTQEALLATLARMFQVVEGMPLTEIRRKH